MSGWSVRSSLRGAPRALVVVLAALSAFVLQPAATGRAGLDDTANAQCPVVGGLPPSTGQFLPYTGQLSCFRPGGQRFGTAVAPPNVQVRDTTNAVPPIGEPCKNLYYYPVVFGEDTSGGASASFQFAGGGAGGTFPFGTTVPVDMPADQAEMIGTHDAYVTDEQLGSYELANPNDPNSQHTCQLNPTFHFFCPATGVDDQFCLTWVDHPIVGTLRQSAWSPFFNSVFGSVNGQPGEIHSAPSTNGVVNVPVCFWIDDITIQKTLQLTLYLAGPPDSSGRRVFYTFLATIQFLGVQWQFDDPDDPSNLHQDLAPPACGSHPQEVGHTYRRISDERNPDGTYHVSAVEQYSITVTVSWIDFAGPHGPQEVPSGVADPSLRPGQYSQRVGQIEGVPIGSP
jgi:hypothetical protein